MKHIDSLYINELSFLCVVLYIYILTFVISSTLQQFENIAHTIHKVCTTGDQRMIFSQYLHNSLENKHTQANNK